MFKEMGIGAVAGTGIGTYTLHEIQQNLLARSAESEELISLGREILIGGGGLIGASVGYLVWYVLTRHIKTPAPSKHDTGPLTFKD